MYGKLTTGGATVGGGTALAATGATGWLWMLIAAVTLIAAGAALWRIVPRKD